MLSTIFQFSGSILLVLTFLLKNKFSFIAELRTIVKPFKIEKDVAHKQQFEKWVMYIGILEMALGYGIALINYDVFQKSNTYTVFICFLILFSISIFVAFLVAEYTWKGYMEFFNSEKSMLNGQALIYIGNLSGIENDPDDGKIALLEEKIKELEIEMSKFRERLGDKC